MNAPRNTGDWVGRSLSRKEDRRLLTGKGQYFADKKIAGALHLIFVRSQHAHARLVAIDISKAKALKGVVAVVTGDDLRGQIKGLPQPVVVPSFAANYPQFWPLAVDKVKFHGEPVVAIVARDRYVAEDAAALVDITYAPLSVVTDMEAALEPDAPIVHDGWASNEMFAMNFTGGGTPEGEAAQARKVDDALASAAAVIRRRFRMHRCGVTPIEPRGALATWDDDGLTAWITTQRPHIDRLALSDVLEIPSDKVRVIAPRDQGGAFGVKAPFYREPILVCHMARVLGRPVRWLETREEHLMSVSQERDQIHDIEIGADASGRIVALRDNAMADNGDGCEGVYWGFVMPFFGAAVLTNAYDIPLCDIRLRVACTNKAVLSPGRSFGAFAARFALDRAIDLLGRELGIDPAEMRRRNLIASLPYVSATGIHHDSGDYVKVFNHLTDLVDLEGFRVEQAEARKVGRYIGIGFAVGAELSGMASAVLVAMENQPGFGAAAVRIDPRGKVQLFEGDAPQGQSHETSMAQVAAQELGIDPSDISLTTGDTGTTPFGSGTIGARGGSYTVSASPTPAARCVPRWRRCSCTTARLRRVPTRCRSATARSRCATTRRCGAASPRSPSASSWPRSSCRRGCRPVWSTPSSSRPTCRCSASVPMLRSSRWTRRPASSRSSATSRPTTSATSSTRSWSRVRSTAASSRASRTRCSRSSSTTRTASS